MGTTEQKTQLGIEATKDRNDLDHRIGESDGLGAAVNGYATQQVRCILLPASASHPDSQRSPRPIQQHVRLIRIHSGWGGMGTPKSADVTVQHENGVFLRDGKATDPALVRKLVEAVQASPKLNLSWENLGITPTS